MKLSSVDEQYSAVQQKKKKKKNIKTIISPQKITVVTIDYLLLLLKTIQNIRMTKRLNRTDFSASSS